MIFTLHDPNETTHHRHYTDYPWQHGFIPHADGSRFGGALVTIAVIVASIWVGRWSLRFSPWPRALMAAPPATSSSPPPAPHPVTKPPTDPPAREPAWARPGAVASQVRATGWSGRSRAD
jgi:hypothetical protein